METVEQMAVLDGNSLDGSGADIIYVTATEELATNRKSAYQKSYYTKNLEKSRAYNRAYSAKMRNDDNRREAINAQKRELMRRLNERRKNDPENHPPPKPRKSTGSHSKAPRKNYSQYYRENKESMQRSNRKYYEKMKADPEKRRINNERKKLAMRRLKEKRKLEAMQLSVTEPEEPVESEVVEVNVNYTDSLDVTNESTDDIPEHPNSMIELVIKGEAEQEEEEADILEELEHETEVEYIEEEAFTEYFQTIFPQTVSTYLSISDADLRRDLVEYIENCAKEFHDLHTSGVEEVIQ